MFLIHIITIKPRQKYHVNLRHVFKTSHSTPMYARLVPFVDFAAVFPFAPHLCETGSVRLRGETNKRRVGCIEQRIECGL